MHSTLKENMNTFFKGISLIEIQLYALQLGRNQMRGWVDKNHVNWGWLTILDTCRVAVTEKS